MQNLAASAIRLEQAYGTSAGIPASTHEAPLREEVDHELAPGESHTDSPANLEPPRGSVAQVQASRIKWEKGPSFDPLPFIEDAHLRAVYLDPRTNRTDPADWPKLPGAKVHIDDANFVELMQKWDAVGTLRLFVFSTEVFDYD